MSNPDEYTEDLDIDIPAEEEMEEKLRRLREPMRVSDWLKKHEKGTKVYQRVANAHKKHPGWSLEELRYGYKSKRAREYRERRVPAGKLDYRDLAQSFNDAGLVVVARSQYDEEHYAKLILARDHKRLFAYGGLIRYDPGRDRHRPQSDLAKYVIGEIKSKIEKPKGRKR